MNVTALPDNGLPQATLSKDQTRQLVFDIALIGLLALSTRVGLLSVGPRFDELYHFIAARNWLETGEFQILDGTYDRAYIYTMAVGWVFQLVGGSYWEPARFLSVFSSVLLTGVVFLWSRLRIGRSAAWICALLLVFWPNGIESAQTLRFYAPHALFVSLAIFGAYDLVTQPMSLARRSLTAIGVGCCFAIGMHLQVLTVIAACGFAGWLSLSLLTPHITGPYWQRWVGVLIAGLIAFLAVGAVNHEAVGAFITDFRFAPLWAEPNRDNAVFYSSYLRRMHPVLWTLAPFIALAAVARYPRPMIFCLCVFGSAILVHSLAGMKHERYILYLLPFLFVVLGTGLSVIGPPALDYAKKCLERCLKLLPGRAFQMLLWPIFAICCLFVLAVTPSFKDSVLLAFGHTTCCEKGAGKDMKDAVGDWMKQKPVVITTSELSTTYHLGGYDVLFHGGRLEEVAFFHAKKKSEFLLDPRTGRPIISNWHSVERLMSCRASLIIIAKQDWWQNQRMAVKEIFGGQWRRRTRKVGNVEIDGWFWRGGTRKTDCSALPEIIQPK
ncbi:MAG: hypothetical protein K0U74_08635 [Alphaproteobacteria bacterium]|nr:hypothetical protein [Alphaproteobacteria bacterium]